MKHVLSPGDREKMDQAYGLVNDARAYLSADIDQPQLIETRRSP